MSRDNKERTFGALMIILLGIGGFAAVLWATGNFGGKIEITTAECPMAPTVQTVTQMDGGWKCTSHEDYDGDLLQPSGYWVNQIFDCWKKEMTIEEYCDKYPCSSNGGKPPHPVQ